MIIPIVLTGGTGTRLWPLSRSSYPKQFLALTSQYSLFQETVLRLQRLSDVAPPLVICNQEHRFIVAEQLQLIGVQDGTLILEPLGKNTAPAAAIAALHCLPENPLLLVLPSDHLIQEISLLQEAIKQGEVLAEQGKLVTFGIRPTRAEIAYGYIKTIKKEDENAAYAVEAFVEKPSLQVAKEYFNSGHYFWNSGMFLFRASQFLEELKLFSPTIMDVCSRTMLKTVRDLDFIRLDQDLFSSCPSDSIDYAIMEKTRNAAVVVLETGWSDVGSWDALYEVQNHDQQGNVIQGDVVVENTTGSYVRAESRMVVTLGVKNQIIIETPDAVLVADKEKSQEIKNIVELLKKNKRREAETHQKVYRPWGFYETLCFSKNFQVKRITLKIGASLSLQLHHHRSEHWVVVKGQAQVTRDNDVFLLYENQSSYIPKKAKHRLMNVGQTELEIIEVQLGSYLGEDDIVRLEDHYGRVKETV